MSPAPLIKRPPKNKGFNWVEGLSPELSQRLLAQAKLRVVGDGTMVIRQGTPATEVYQVLSGELRQTILTEEGLEVLFYNYQVGDVVGDSSIADEEPYAVTLTARGATTLRVWAAKDFQNVRSSSHEMEIAIATQTSRRLRESLRIIEELLTQSSAARVASRLYWLADIQQASGQDAVISVSQTDIGLMAGSSRQNVNRVMNDLRKLGIIETGYGTIRVKDFEKLQQFITAHRQSHQPD